MSFLTKLFSSPKRQSTTIPTTPVSDDWELISSLEAVSDVGDNTPTPPPPASPRRQSGRQKKKKKQSPRNGSNITR
ncbi:hypothetical protein A1F94_002805 [Pyrenophora tritici-repentis]|nr:hypothetical protein A1F94_002805 [Pyrenophora tritici-repentis]KAI0582950.1 hypothetical protein Alg215_03851 [Pyrenophora tritici-repentis]KAI0624519.1 hypothetical protein TUN199_03484 [Pyrenophora tritici-repentis]KAI1541990.1 hypothetical protein PtrSN001A_003631 [Pyrenophora tritici-repentis]KAI1542941.1 hypothetical protein PtrSN001C_004026 [Pyrenophora tritici-repentis]